MPRLKATHVGNGPDGKAIYRPIIIVEIELNGLIVSGPALVDSGADNTLVPFDAVQPLGVTFLGLPSGHSGAGPGGALDTRPCQAVLRWDKVVLMTDFTVAEPGKGPETILLGRADFFQLYIPRFHWHKDPPEFDLDPITRGHSGSKRGR